MTDGRGKPDRYTTEHMQDAGLSGMDELYRDFILDHYRNPRNAGTLENPDATFEDLNPLCGDKIRMDLRIADGRVSDVKFKGRGCAISQASASLLTEEIKGKTLDEIDKIGKDEVLANVGINISAVRLKCALLGLKVLKQALALKYEPSPEEIAYPDGRRG